MSLSRSATTVPGRVEIALGSLRPLQPAHRLLALDRQSPTVLGCALMTGVDLRPDQSQTGSAVGLDRQHRMDEQTGVLAVADRTQAPRSSGMGLIVQFAGVLDGQNVQASDAGAHLLADRALHLHQSDLGVVQPAPEAGLFTATVRQTPKTDGRALDHPSQQMPPPFSSRSSLKRPTMSTRMSIRNALPQRTSPTESHTVKAAQHQPQARVNLSHQKRSVDRLGCLRLPAPPLDFSLP